MKSIYRLVLLVLMGVCSITLVAQAPSAGSKIAPKVEDKGPVFRGVSAHIDIASPLMGKIIDRSIKNAEALVDVNLLDKYFPVLEVGYAYLDKVGANGIAYTAQAPFFKLGANFNLLKSVDKKGKRKNMDSYGYLGLRYGLSPVRYDLSGVTVEDGYWGGSAPVDFPTKVAYAGWGEIVAGVRVDMIKGFTMGWSVRFKSFLHTNISPKAQMWYVPGYGNSDGSAFSFNYTLGYTFRTKSSRIVTDKK